jgi:hypothetical protein
LARKLKGKAPLGRLRHRWNDNINMVLQEVRWGASTGLIWLRIGTGGGSFKSGDEPSGSIKCGNFLGYLKTGQLGKKDLTHGVSKYTVYTSGLSLRT